MSTEKKQKSLGDWIGTGCIWIVGAFLAVSAVIIVFGGGYILYDHLSGGPMKQGIDQTNAIQEKFDQLCANEIPSVVQGNAKGPLYVVVRSNSHYFRIVESTDAPLKNAKILLCINENVTTGKGTCTYNSSGTIPIKRNDVTITLVGVESGQILAANTFLGPERTCPESVPVGSVVVPPQGYVDKEEIRNWVKENWSP
jgi:hypothetical protein